VSDIGEQWSPKSPPPSAVPISNQMGVDSSIAIAAALGGRLFGDHCSPISDTSVISSMASASDHIDHVKTQIPYALISRISFECFKDLQASFLLGLIESNLLM
jgi:hypothetical protein